MSNAIPKTDNLPNRLSVSDIAKLLNTTPYFVYKLYEREDFPVVRVGKRQLRIVRKDKFLEWLERNKK